MRSLLAGLAIYGVGCIIPAPLEAEPEPQFSPLILAASPDEFGQVSKGTDEEWGETITALDGNIDDVLTARVLARDGKGFVSIVQKDIVLLPNRNDLTTRTGTFGPFQFCAFTQVSRADGGYVYVCVTDGTLNSYTGTSPFDPKQRFSTGRFDCKYWVVKCGPRA